MLRKTPFVPPCRFAKMTLVNRRLGVPASPTRSWVSPVGRPDPAPPGLLIRVKVAPPSVLRQMPMLVSRLTSAASTASTMVVPRTAMPARFFVTSVPPPLTRVQLLPALVERYRPTRSPSRRPTELRVPTPAHRVRRVASLRSKSRAPIDEVGMMSVKGRHVGLASWSFVVFQTPPLTDPMYSTLRSVGWGRTTWIAPVIASSGAAFSLCPPTAGPGPCGVHFLLGLSGGGCPWATGTATAAVTATSAASATPRTTARGRNSLLQLLLDMSRDPPVGCPRGHRLGKTAMWFRVRAG